MTRKGLEIAWYAVHTRALKEDLADRNLQRIGIETYFPHTTEWLGKNSETSRLVRKPMLSRYLFVQTERERLHEVNETVGVSTVLYAAGAEPLPISDEIIEALRKRFGPSGKLFRNPAPTFEGAAGQEFRFGENSPLFGFAAQIICVLDNERIRVKFLETLFGASGREMVVPVAEVGELLPRTGSARN